VGNRGKQRVRKNGWNLCRSIRHSKRPRHVRQTKEYAPLEPTSAASLKNMARRGARPRTKRTGIDGGEKGIRHEVIATPGGRGKTNLRGGRNAGFLRPAINQRGEKVWSRIRRWSWQRNDPSRDRRRSLAAVRLQAKAAQNGKEGKKGITRFQPSGSGPRKKAPLREDAFHLLKAEGPEGVGRKKRKRTIKEGGTRPQTLSTIKRSDHTRRAHQSAHLLDQR